jgi:hypothetical protein
MKAYLRFGTALVAALVACTAAAVSVISTQHWDIGTDIQGSERLNGVSYQEDVLISFGDYQYVTFYSTAPAGYGNHYVNVGRRRIAPSVGGWEFLTLTDYVQKTMDGHNMISMGISGDGRIHLSFDHHVSILRAYFEEVYLDLIRRRMFRSITECLRARLPSMFPLHGMQTFLATCCMRCRVRLAPGHL